MTTLPSFADAANLERDEPPEIATPEDALALLRAIYKCPDVPLSVRMRAAEAALPYERPKLAVQVQATIGGDFAEMLNAARLRMKSERATPIIEGSPSPIKPEPALVTDASGPFTHPRRNGR